VYGQFVVRDLCELDYHRVIQGQFADHGVVGLND